MSANVRAKKRPASKNGFVAVTVSLTQEQSKYADERAGTPKTPPFYGNVSAFIRSVLDEHEKQNWSEPELATNGH